MVLMTRAKNQTERTDYNHAHRGTSHITASVFIIIFPRSSIMMQSCTETSHAHQAIPHSHTQGLCESFWFLPFACLLCFRLMVLYAIVKGTFAIV